MGSKYGYDRTLQCSVPSRLQKTKRDISYETGTKDGFIDGQRRPFFTFFCAPYRFHVLSFPFLIVTPKNT